MVEEFQPLREDVVRRVFSSLRQAGQLPVILAVLRAHGETLQTKITLSMEQIDISSPSQIGEFGKLQGRLAETNRLIRVFDAWASEDFRRRDDDGELAD